MSDLAASTIAVDLSRLAPPAALRPLDFETRFAEILTSFRARYPDHDALLESDPVMKLLEELAYRDVLGTAEINDTVRALLLAFAAEQDLDHIAARMNIARRVIRPAEGNIPALMESDAELRRRVQLAPERFPLPGRTAGGYVAITLEAAPLVKDVGLVRREGGRVDVILLGREGDGTVPAEIVQAVYRALEPDDASGLTDIVSVASATIIPYAPTLTVHVRSGPDPTLVRNAVETSVRAFAADRHRIGAPVFAQMLAAAAGTAGIERVEVDIDDVAVGPREAAWLQSLTVNVAIAV